MLVSFEEAVVVDCLLLPSLHCHIRITTPTISSTTKYKYIRAKYAMVLRQMVSAPRIFNTKYVPRATQPTNTAVAADPMTTPTAPQILQPLGRPEMHRHPLEQQQRQEDTIMMITNTPEVYIDTTRQDYKR